jgi:transcriptional regulator with XRE-family HTH domain
MVTESKQERRRQGRSGEGRRQVSATLGSKIRQARQDAGLSQGQLASALNTTQSAISLYEGGARSVGIDMLLNVARILNRPLRYFLDEDEGDILYVKDSLIAELISDLEAHPEDLPRLMEYWRFLTYQRGLRNGNGRRGPHPQPVEEGA